MIAGFPTGTICKEGTRYVDHMGRALVLVDNRGTATRANAQDPRFDGAIPQAQAGLAVCLSLPVAAMPLMTHGFVTGRLTTTGAVDYGGDHQDRVVPPHV